MRPSDLFRWKTYFYDALLPALRHLGPERADATLAALGQLSAWVWPPYRRRLAASLARLENQTIPVWSAHASNRVAGVAASANAEPCAFRDLEDQTPAAPIVSQPGVDRSGASIPCCSPADLAAGSLRFLARDYLLATNDDARALARFDVSGGSGFDAALAGGRGVILVGGHLGGHLAAFHWLYRRGVPLRVMVQRPSHVSRELAARFDRKEPDPQSDFFLRRGLGATDCVARLLRARAAMRAGKVVYFAGDIPWTGPNTRAGSLLGRRHRFLSVWTDLSALTGAPVVFTFCTHRPGGRFDLRFEPVGRIARGGEDAAVATFLAHLEATIAAHPCDAVAHLTWPCYGPPVAAPATLPRPGRHAATLLAARH